VLVGPNIDLRHALPAVRSMDCQKAFITPLVFPARTGHRQADRARTAGLVSSAESASLRARSLCSITRDFSS
jgi:hypothetical protein